VAWLRRAAQRDYVKAEYNLGVMYENGWGVPLDQIMAEQWFRKAAGHGYEMAAAKLRDMAGSNTIPPEKLLEAARKGEAGEVPALIVHGADVNAVDVYGRTALMEAAEAGHDDIVEMLLQAGARPNGKDRYDDDALLLAVREGHKQSVESIIAAGADVNVPDANGNTPLLLAVTQRDPELVAVLLQDKADVNIRNKRNWSAVQYAQSRGYKDIVADLVAHGAKLEHVKSRIQARLAATAAPEPKLADGKQPYQGWSPLMIAAWRGQEDVVQGLLAEGADVTLRDEEGHTALTRAAWRGYSGIITALLHKGQRQDGLDVGRAARPAESGARLAGRWRGRRFAARQRRDRFILRVGGRSRAGGRRLAQGRSRRQCGAPGRPEPADGGGTTRRKAIAGHPAGSWRTY
jgi:ankyrin repeat protein